MRRRIEIQFLQFSTGQPYLWSNVWARIELQIAIGVRDRDGDHAAVPHSDTQLQILAQDERLYLPRKSYAEHCKKPNGYSWS